MLMDRGVNRPAARLREAPREAQLALAAEIFKTLSDPTRRYLAGR